jgi:hypothetical protein
MKKNKTSLETMRNKINDYRIWLVAVRCQIAKPGYHLDLSLDKIENSKSLLAQIGTRSADMLVEIRNSGLDCGEIGSILEHLAECPRTVFDVTSTVLCCALDPDDLNPENLPEKEVLR